MKKEILAARARFMQTYNGMAPNAIAHGREPGLSGEASRSNDMLGADAPERN